MNATLFVLCNADVDSGEDLNPSQFLCVTSFGLINYVFCRVCSDEEIESPDQNKHSGSTC